jgi:hypothetical protein
LGIRFPSGFRKSEGLREAAEAEQGVDVRLRRRGAQLPQREGMQTEGAVAIGQRVAALAGVVETRRAGDDDAPARPLGVVEPLHEIPPARVLVDLVQDQERLARGQLEPAQARRGPRIVPVEIGRMRLVGPRTEQRQREGRLADLPRTTDEDHFARKHGRHDAFEVAPPYDHILEHSLLYS